MTEIKVSKGCLFLIPTPIGIYENSINNSIPSANIGIINSLDEFIVEELRTARRFLKKSGYKKTLDEVIFHLLNEHSKLEDISTFLDSAIKGKNIGLLSEAGCPCIADPGNTIVSLAHRNNIRVVPLIGPSSIILSLIASGFNGQNFCFEGYLPQKADQRIHKIKEIERTAYNKNQTQIFIEAPYRNQSMLKDIISVCKSETFLCVATELATPDELIISKPIGKWRKLNVDINKKNTVFLLYRG